MLFSTGRPSRSTHQEPPPGLPPRHESGAPGTQHSNNTEPIKESLMSNARNVLITGASTGFGFDAARALAERGHTVYATMRGVAGKNAGKAKELEGWARDGGYELKVLELDVTDEGSVNQALAKTAGNGGIDVVINNAGIGNWGIDEGYSVDQARQIFDVNLFGVMRVNRAVVPKMREAGKGTIVYVTSGLGRFVFPFVSIYAATKYALEAFAESTNYELAPLGIESEIIQPGAYGTSILGNTLQPTTDVMR
jgi:NAD(P)-dependent dehydrogenase (short-subunit alcohol dehydrogenase family)